MSGHKFKLGDRVRYVRKNDDEDEFSSPSKYDGHVGVVIAVCSRPEYSCDYVIALQEVPHSQYRNKKHKQHVSESELTLVEKIKGYAYSAADGSIQWYTKEMTQDNLYRFELTRRVEFDFEKELDLK
jgi:hypothetical protein